jgi:hypothetical protein
MKSQHVIHDWTDGISLVFIAYVKPTSGFCGAMRFARIPLTAAHRRSP